MNAEYTLFRYELRANRQRPDPILAAENIRLGDNYLGMTRQQKALSLRKKIP